MLDKYHKIMITGGAGFIGSHLCEEILKSCKEVIVIDDLSTGKPDNIPEGTGAVQA